MGIKLTAEGKKQAEQARSKLGVNKTVLAERLGIARATLNNFFAGKPVTHENFQMICNTLKLGWEKVADFGEEVSYLEATQNQEGWAAEKPIAEIGELPEDLDENVKESKLELAPFDLLGRGEDYGKLEKLSKQAKIVLIKAGAGVGKSTLAREFLETQFEKVIRLEMGLESGNVTPAEEKISQILRKDFDEEPSRDFGINLDILRTRLSDRAHPIGVLLDNLEPALDENYRFRENLRGYEDLLRVLGDRDVCSFTLITSRRSLIVQRMTVREYLLEGLNIATWRQYFHDCGKVETSEALMQMCDAYNGNAKVMGILHRAIKNRFEGNIGAYWNRYKNALLADAELETLILVEMDWLQDNQPDAYKLLCRMGCYRYQDVKTVPFEGLICLLWDVPGSRQKWVVSYLSKTSLIEVKGEYYLHPTVREAAKLRLRENQTDWETANRKAANFWTISIEIIRDINDALIAFEAFYHYLSIENYQLAGDVIIQERKDQGGNNQILGRSFLKIGCLWDTMKTSILDVVENIQNEELISKLYSVLGNISILTGEMRKGINYHEISKKKAIEAHSEEFEINAFFNIAYSQLATFDIDLSKENFEAVVKLSKGLNPREHTIDALLCLAFVYLEIGNKKDVIDLIAQATELEENSNSINPLEYAYYFENSLGYTYYFLGRAYKNIGNLSQSDNIYDWALKFAKISNSSIIKAAVLTGVAENYCIKGDMEKALLNHENSIKILEQSRAIAALSEAYFQLGLTYQAMGKHDQAEEYKEKALKLFEQMEAPKQIERVKKAFE